MANKNPVFTSALSSSSPDARWEFCTVTNVYPNSYSCDVSTDSGKTILNVPWPTAYADPNGSSGEVNVPKRGQRLVIHLLTEPQLVYSAPKVQPPTTGVETEHRVSYNSVGVGGLDSAFAQDLKKTFRGKLPPDVVPGDWLRVGSKGNMVGVLEGGVSIVKASEYSKVIANNVNDLLQLIGRNMDIVSDFGEIKFRNDGGHVSMTLKGGSQQKTETGAGEEKYTIHAALGYDGELVDFKITDQKGIPLAQIHYGQDGSVTSLANNKDETLGGNYTFTVAGTGSETFDSTHTFTVTGDSSETISGQKKIVASGINLGSGADVKISSFGDTDLHVGGQLNMSVGGSVVAKPGDAAVKSVITNGSWVIDIGGVGDLGAALSGFKVQTYLGNIVLDTLMGNIKLNTLQPNSVQLGGQYPAFHAVLFEVLEYFFTMFGLALNLHTHPTAGVGPPSIPEKPIWGPDVSSILKLAKSHFVTLGG